MSDIVNFACDVSIIVPTIGKSELLEGMIECLSRSENVTIQIIVSQSGSQRIYSLPQDVFYLRTRKRLMASVSRNLASQYAIGEYLFFLDDDNVIDENLVFSLMKVLQQHRSVVLVGPIMYYKNYPNQVHCSGVDHRKVFGLTRCYTDNSFGQRTMRVCDAVPNAFMVRRREFETINGFDSKTFPMDFEESDLAFRLRRSFNGSVVITSTASVWHDARPPSAQALVPKSIDRAYTMGRNRSLFYVRHYSSLSWLSWIICGMPVMWLVYIIAIAKAKDNSVRNRLSLTLSLSRGYYDGIVESVKWKWYSR